jgi:hypothetical protein
MEEEPSADAMSATVDPTPVTTGLTGFDLATSQVLLMVCLGFYLPRSTSPFANMPPEMVRMLANCFCTEQNSYLEVAGLVTPPASPRGAQTSVQPVPPLLTRANRLRTHQPTTAQGGVARSFGELE